jgi:hypothetical protein
MKARPGKTKKSKAKQTAKPGLPSKQRFLRQHVVYPQMKGRVIEQVELYVSSDYRCVSIRCTDKTAFTVTIDSCLTFQAEHSKWKGGEQRVLERWPVVLSD